jgi:hypothetical protein
MIRFLLAVLAFAASPAFATAVQADAPAGATQCGFYLNTATTATVVAVSAGTCKLTLSTSLAPGTHTVTADARYPEPIWGVTTSPKSAPFSFTKPAPGGASPSNFQLVP